MIRAAQIETAARLLRSGEVCTAWNDATRRQHAEKIERLWRTHTESGDELLANLRAIGLDAEPAHMIGQEGE